VYHRLLLQYADVCIRRNIKSVIKSAKNFLQPEKANHVVTVENTVKVEDLMLENLHIISFSYYLPHDQLHF
jgi:hypothetical protein